MWAVHTPHSRQWQCPTLSHCVTEVMPVTYDKLAEKEEEEIGWSWILATDGYILRAMWQGGVSAPLGIRKA